MSTVLSSCSTKRIVETHQTISMNMHSQRGDISRRARAPNALQEQCNALSGHEHRLRDRSASSKPITAISSGALGRARNDAFMTPIASVCDTAKMAAGERLVRRADSPIYPPSEYIPRERQARLFLSASS